MPWKCENGHLFDVPNDSDFVYEQCPVCGSRSIRAISGEEYADLLRHDFLSRSRRKREQVFSE